MPTEVSTHKKRPAGYYARAALEMVSNGTNRPSMYLQNYRIAGPKPWGGGATTESYSVPKRLLREAAAAAQHLPHPHTLELAVWYNASGNTRIMLDNQVIFAGTRSLKDMTLSVCFPVTLADLQRALT